ncbi:MAG TPA: hypothetical protein PKE06_03065 [Flavilitoribacter sp.]|nr:hypothetical protein [Flavilitoribacter sp.]HMQ86832.1 hypothetical protein [Flavilitoribacter sp.]
MKLKVFKNSVQAVILSLFQLAFCGCGMKTPEGEICFSNSNNERIVFDFRKSGMVFLTDEVKKQTFQGQYS